MPLTSRTSNTGTIRAIRSSSSAGANDDDGNPVIIVIGVHTIKADRINAMLINERAAIQTAANAAYKPGESEVVLFAPATLALAS
jgi:hypothetical protein